MRQVAVDARGKGNRAEQFHVVTTILDASIDGGQVGELYERRWDGEVDIRSIKSALQMDVLRCQSRMSPSGLLSATRLSTRWDAARATRSMPRSRSSHARK